MFYPTSQILFDMEDFWENERRMSTWREFRVQNHFPLQQKQRRLSGVIKRINRIQEKEWQTYVVSKLGCQFLLNNNKFLHLDYLIFLYVWDIMDKLSRFQEVKRYMNAWSSNLQNKKNNFSIDLIFRFHSPTQFQVAFTLPRKDFVQVPLQITLYWIWWKLKELLGGKVCASVWFSEFIVLHLQAIVPDPIIKNVWWKVLFTLQQCRKSQISGRFNKCINFTNIIFWGSFFFCQLGRGLDKFDLVNAFGGRFWIHRKLAASFKTYGYGGAFYHFLKI